MRADDDSGATLDSVYRWCMVALGARVESVLFRTGHLASMLGLSLSDGRRVVVNVRSDDVQIRAVAEIQRRLFPAGCACPPVTAGPFSIGRRVFTAEGFVEAGSLTGEPPVGEMAALMAEVVGLAGNAEDAPALLNPLPWLAWDHGGSGLWPAPDDLDVDLNDLVPWFRVPDGADPKVRALARSAHPALHNANLSSELAGDLIGLAGSHAKVRRDGYRAENS